MRLLICDDYKPLVDALSMALTQLGLTVVATALDPDEAVAAARKHQPDACLLDISFPRDNGLSAIARIRGVSADTNVVMLSGSISTELVGDAIALGAQGFVGKHQPVGVIVEALEQACQGHLAVDPIFMPDMPQPHATKDNPVIPERSCPESRTRWHHPADRTRGGRRNLRGLLQQRNLSCTTPIRGPIRITVPNIDSAGSWEIALATMC